MTSNALSLSLIEGEPRVHDLLLADHLGFAQPRDIRKIIKRNEAKLLKFGICATVAQIHEGAGRPTDEYYLNQKQAIFICMKSETEKAFDVQIDIVRVFDAYLQMGDEVHHPRFRPEKTRKALPGGLTVEQQDAVKALIKSRVEILPHNAQVKAAITCWSAVKSKFGVSYKEVPAANFPDVLSLVARLPLDGELLKAPKGKYRFPLSFWQPTNRKGATGWLTWDELTRIENADRPIAGLLAQLAKDGCDVEGARVEYRAMRLLLESMHWTLNDIAARVNVIPHLGLNVAF